MSTILIAMAIAGVVMFIIFFVFLVGGTNRMKASRVVSKRGFTPDVPTSADGVMQFLLPRGFVLQPLRPALADWRDEFRVTWRASLGAFSSKLGSGSSGELKITAALSNDPQAARPFYQDWRVESQTGGLTWYTGRPPGHTSSLGAWSPKGFSVTLWSEEAYTREQARVIVAAVLDSIELNHSAWRAAHSRILANTAHGATNRDLFRKILTEKLAPLPEDDGAITVAPKGRGLIFREAEDQFHVILILGSIPIAAGNNPLATAQSYRIDRGRIHRGFATSWDEIDGAPDAGIHALWVVSRGGSAQLFDMQRQSFVELNPGAAAVYRQAAQPDRVVLIRHWTTGNYRDTPAWQFEQWLDGSLAIAEWARDSAPVWIPNPTRSK